ncbi:MAG: P63C domain-containing protein [Bacteroidales bacterium]|jgi:hypothetical protein
MIKEKLPRATHSGQIEVAGFKIDCYNLDNGERVLSRIGFLRAMGRKGKAKGGRKYDSEFQTPVFLSATNIKSLITNEILENSKPIFFYDLSGNTSIGYQGNLLPQTAFLYSQAYDKGLLKPNQFHIGEQSKILVKGFLRVSIISLIDEATGYQYDREQNELQTILKLFISEEILAWQKAFHLNFYKEIFRLWNVPFTDKNISRKPQFIGKLTNELVYKNLPKGTFILEKLKSKTPKTIGGNFRYRLHQSLTADVGREALKKVIYSVETLATISDSKEQFKRLVEDRYGQREIHFAEFWDIVETPKINKPTDFDKELIGLLNVPPEKKE